MNPPPCWEYSDFEDGDLGTVIREVATMAERRRWVRGVRFAAQVAVVTVGLWVLGCVNGALPRPWCE